MPIRLFHCPQCHEAHQFDAMTMAESPQPLFYTCTGCYAQVNHLPDEVLDERRPAKPRRKLGVF